MLTDSKYISMHFRVYIVVSKNYKSEIQPVRIKEWESERDQSEVQSERGKIDVSRIVH